MSDRHPVWFSRCSAALFAASVIFADGSGALAQVSSQPSGPSVVTVTAPVEPPVIDGQIEDQFWREATRLDRFVQQRPLEGAPASEATQVWLAFDRDHLYVAVDARYVDPGILRANYVDRDQIWQDDTLRVFIDPFLDQQRAYVFAVNARGIQGDSILAPGAGGGGGGGGGNAGDLLVAPGDDSWNALFRSAGRVTDEGWTAELAIPFKSLRYPVRGPGETHRWGLQIQRTVPGRNEVVVWSPLNRAIRGFLRQFGELRGLQDLSTSRNLELQPTITAVSSAARTDTGTFGRDTSGEAGLNARYGLTSDLTLDFTVNPDFSQIESDDPQIETNRRFPIFVAEQRPFFVEGQENFALQAPVTVLHTRTVVAPRFGAKITGKLGRTLLGILVADDEAPGRLDDPAEPGFGQSARVLVGRARRVLYGDSAIGAVVTSRAFAGSSSHLAGVDGQFRIGSTLRLRAVALAARHRDLDADLNRGHTWQVRLDRQGRSLSYTALRAVVSPGFRTDLGFVRRTDTRTTELEFEYAFWPETWLTTWGPVLRFERTHDAAGVLHNNTVSAGLRAQFAANMTADVTVNRELEHFEGIDFRPSRVVIGGTYDGSRLIALRGTYRFGRSIRFVDSPFLGRGTESDLTVNLRPTSRFRSELTLRTSRLTDPRSGAEEFDVRILRTLSTYQFTSRLLVRNITEYNTARRTIGTNVLATYRVNAGTALFVGYDDRFEGSVPSDTDEDARLIVPWRRANHAVFAKLQVLLRY